MPIRIRYLPFVKIDRFSNKLRCYSCNHIPCVKVHIKEAPMQTILVHITYTGVGKDREHCKIGEKKYWSNSMHGQKHEKHRAHTLAIIVTRYPTSYSIELDESETTSDPSP